MLTREEIVDKLNYVPKNTEDAEAFNSIIDALVKQGAHNVLMDVRNNTQGDVNVRS